jgi:hypothetical protein
MHRPLIAPTCLLFAVAALYCAGAASAAGTTKGAGQTFRWVDEKGEVHYGDRVPPEYSSGERSILNQQGVEVKRLEAQKSPEQLAAEEKREQDNAHQKQHDAFLLTTYATIKDLESLRDLRLDQIEGQIRAGTQYIESIDARLRALQGRILVFKPYSPRQDARRMPDDLAENLVHTINEARTQRVAMDAKRAEKESVRQQFQSDIDRYRELKSPMSQARR